MKAIKMKAIKKISFWSVAVLVVMGLSTPSMAVLVWSENFEDGDDLGWREHTGNPNAPDQPTALTVTSGTGVGGSFGWERTGPTTAQGTKAEGIWTLGGTAGLANGDIQLLSADVQLGVVAGNTRTGLTWGYDVTGFPVPHYEVVIEGGGAGPESIDINRSIMTNSPATETLVSGTEFVADTQFHTLAATFQRIGNDIFIEAFYDGVQMASILDTGAATAFTAAPFGMTTNVFAGVVTGFNSTDDGTNPGVVFDNISLSTGIPEPASLGLMVLGVSLMLVRRTKK